MENNRPERPNDEFSNELLSSEEISRQRTARHLRQLVGLGEDIDRLLEAASRLAKQAGFENLGIEQVRNAIRSKTQALSEEPDYSILPRRNPSHQLTLKEAAARNRSLVFIDECGSHHNSNKNFPYFVVTAVVARSDEYSSISDGWKDWRRTWLKNPDYATHEPRLRPGKLRYSLKRYQDEDRALEALDELINGFPMQVVAAVLDHTAFSEKYGRDPVDEFLPRDSYLMCFTFAMERVVDLLYHGASDTVGDIVADQRGLKEDALLERELQRMKTEGTLFLSPSWFRYSLGRHIEFRSRNEDEVGLQLADLLARSVAERYKDPSVVPAHWNVVRKKLYAVEPTDPSPHGLKVFPRNVERWQQMIGK